MTWSHERWIAVLALAIVGYAPGLAHCACDKPNFSIDAFSLERIAEQIRTRLVEGDFTCALSVAGAWSSDIPTLDGETQQSARSALRVLALETGGNATYPAPIRLDFLKLATNSSTNDVDERRADARVMFLGARQFQTQNDHAAFLTALTEALHRDRLLPDGGRAISGWELTSLVPETRGREFLPQLLVLAETVQGDPGMSEVRSRLASVLTYNMSVWRQNDPTGEVARRAEDVLNLTRLLMDVPSCHGCGDSWYWRPIMQVGTAYLRIGRTADADREIARALKIVRDIADPNQRMYRLYFALIDLLSSSYDPKVIREIVLELHALSHSLATPNAAETRKRLPEIVKTWKIGVSLPPGAR